jgi:hypothetical protein
LLLGGLSLGAQIVLEMLCQWKNVCRYALVESAAVLPDRLTHALIAPAFGTSYGLTRNKSFARLQFRSLHIRPALFEDYWRDTREIQKADMIAFLKANTGYALKASVSACAAETHVIVGGKENRRMRQSAKLLGETIPESDVNVLPGLYHGEFSLNRAEEYARMVRRIAGRESP